MTSTIYPLLKLIAFVVAAIAIDKHFTLAPLIAGMAINDRLVPLLRSRDRRLFGAAVWVGCLLGLAALCYGLVWWYSPHTHGVTHRMRDSAIAALLGMIAGLGYSWDTGKASKPMREFAKTNL